MDSLPDFPRNAVHTSTEALLTSVFEMGTGEPRPSGRPKGLEHALFIKIMVIFGSVENVSFVALPIGELCFEWRATCQSYE